VNSFSVAEESAPWTYGMPHAFNAIAALATILIAMAVIVRLISIEDALKMIGRVVLLLFLALLAICLVHGLLIGVIRPWLVSSVHFLGVALGCTLIAAIVVGALVLIGYQLRRKVEP